LTFKKSFKTCGLGLKLGGSHDQPLIIFYLHVLTEDYYGKTFSNHMKSYEPREEVKRDEAEDAVEGPEDFIEVEDKQ